MDEKYMKRYESFRNSLRSLAEAKERDMDDPFVLSGTGAKFSITFELAWKVMKDILVQRYSIINFVTGSPKEVLRQAFKAGLIADERWMEMLKVRNGLAHDYDGLVIKESCRAIVDAYIDVFYELEDAVTRISEMEDG